MKFSTILKGAAITGAAMLAAKGLDDRLETTHYLISSEKIPSEFNGFRIAHISDFHASVVPGLVDEIRNESPDIIVSTGDMAHDRGSYENCMILCERLMKIAPVYNVTGNHDLRRIDYKKFQKDLDSTGMVTLHDESTSIKKGDAEITLSGIEDPFSEDGRRIKQNIYRSIGNIKHTDSYHILLFHRANHLNLVRSGGFDLILAGHMHGGQIRLPNGRGVCTPKSSWPSGTPMLFPKYVAGHYRYKKTDMIINRGIGNPMIIPRLFNRPELTMITLKHKGA